MPRYIAQRLLQMIPVFILSSILIFVIIRLIPGDPAQMRLGVEGADEEALRRVREEMGLDKPLAVQYLVWMRQVAQGDFGLSWRSGASAAFLLGKKLPATLWLGVCALLLGLSIALPAGIISATKVHTWLDSLLTGVALLGVSVPSFWLGIMLVLLFAVQLGWLPSGGYVSPLVDPMQGFLRLILPAFTLGVQMAAPLTRFVRSGMLEVMNEEYIRSARSKGLSERAIIIRHALPNAMLSVVTVLGLQIGAMLGGQFVTESVFNWPGVGSMMLDAIRQRDYGIVQAVVMLVVIGFLIVNLLTDILYAALDPRIRLGAGTGQLMEASPMQDTQTAAERYFRSNRLSVRLRNFLSRLIRNRGALFGSIVLTIIVLSAIFAPYVAPYSPTLIVPAEGLQGPSAKHLLGTDDIGRDLLSRIIFGGRVSLLVGVISIGLAMLFGIPLGVIAGFYGGATDMIIMRLMDVLFAFPALVLALFIMAVLGPSAFNAMIAIGIVYTPNFARLVRANVLAIREMTYVEAARSIGFSRLYLMFREILPNCIAPLIVQASLGVAYAILTEAALGFLGLGVQPPTPSWGAMLSEGRILLKQAPWVVTFPGLAIFFSVLALNLLGDGLREALDPRLRQKLK